MFSNGGRAPADELRHLDVLRLGERHIPNRLGELRDWNLFNCVGSALNQRLLDLRSSTSGLDRVLRDDRIHLRGDLVRYASVDLRVLLLPTTERGLGDVDALQFQASMGELMVVCTTHQLKQSTFNVFKEVVGFGQ